MSSVLFVALLVTALATIGRLSTPRHDRLPVTRWSVRDVAANVVLGARFLLTCSDRVQILARAQRLSR